MTTSSTNYTGLYSGNVSGVIPNTAYGNANVVGLLTAGTDGANTVANIIATGNITGNYFVGNGSQLTGIITAAGAAIVNGNSNVTVNANANVTVGIAGTSNVAVFASTGEYVAGVVSATGNITGNYFIGNGSQLTGIVAGTYGNANVATFLAAFGSNTISTTGTVTAGNITGGNVLTGGAVSATGNITGNYILGNGSQLTGLPATYGNANVTTLLASFGSNTISTTGNITGGLFTGNGAGLTNINAGNIVGAYGNANVANFLGSYGSNTLSTTGNVTTGNLNVQLDAVITGNLTVNGNTTLVNSNVVTINDKFINVANNASTAAQANGGGLGVGPVGTEYATLTYNSTNNDWNTNIPLSVTGNVTAGNFVGNGQYLSSIAGANVTGTVANATNATTAGTVTTAAQSNITSVGTLTSLTSSGNISTTGNVTGNYFIGNGSQLTGLPATYGNANVATFLAAFGSNTISTTGNISAGNAALTGNLNFGLVTVRNNSNRLFTDDAEFTNLDIGATLDVTGYVSATGNVTGGNLFTGGAVSATGNIQGNVFIGNGAGLTNIPGGNIVGGYGNANVSDFLANGFGSNTISTTGNISANNMSVSNNITLSSTVTLRNFNNRLYLGDTQVDANLTITGGANTVTIVGGTGNITTPGLISATGNITGNYFLGNGSQLTGLPTQVGGSNTQIQFNDNGAFAGNANVTFDQATGNVTLNQLITGTVGNAAAGLNTITPYTGASFTQTLPGPGQIQIGNGFFGNLNVNNIQARPYAKFQIWDSANVTEVGGNSLRYQALNGTGMISIGNIANTSSLVRGGIGCLAIGGGPSANAWSATAQGLGAVVAFNQFLGVGQPNTVAALGNVTLQHATAALGQQFIYAGSNVGNAAGVLAQLNNLGNVTNGIGMGTWFNNTAAVTPTNLFGFYMPNTTSTYGISSSNSMRAATNYYFLRNDDAVAQNQLGSLRSYHTFQAGGNSTGTWNIDKTNGQVQAVSATGNITIGSYTNFVTTANDGTNNDNQTDTVTLIIEQGATPYTVTMPTGNASIKYANNVSTVSNVANTTTMVAITAYRTAANATGYLTTISPGFV